MSETAAPSWKILKRVKADVSELACNLPTVTAPMKLQGLSSSQISYGESMRAGKLKSWRPDLPAEIYGALLTIIDAGWWIANKDADTENIGWPEHWVRLRDRETRRDGQPNLFNADGEYACPGCGMARTKGSKGCGNPKCLEHRPAKLMDVPWKQDDIDNFEAFARKAAMSPELSYLAMMAMLYRQTKDQRVLVRFSESRMKVQSHLDAIDKILGSPGD